MAISSSPPANPQQPHPATLVGSETVIVDESPETDPRSQGVNPLLLIALLGALIYHGGLSLFGTYQNTYDAYVHIFFADHWTRSWFDHWDTRWYTGFPLISYPPLSQQSVAMLSFFTGDLRVSFAIVQTSAIVVMTLGMYRFARLWVSEEAAGWAAIWLAFSSAMAETIHVFGQLPTTYSLGLLLNALPFAHRWVIRGKPSDLFKAWAIGAATTGAHHVTTLFGAVFIIAPVVVLALVTRFRTPLPDEPTGRPKLVSRANWQALIVRRLRRVLNPIIRSGVYGVGTITLLVLVVFPYWYWSKTDPITQVAIPHASRDNFIANPNAGLVFWLIPYGVLLFAFPYAFYKGATTKAWPLTASIGLLAVLGTGGTTPIPRFLLRGAFDILTLDRFTLWASVLMLPLAGEFVVSLRHKGLAIWIDEQFGQVTLRAVQTFLVVSLLLASIFTVSLTKFRRFQPDPIDVQPIVNFIDKDEHWRWRFMTLGFGDQMAWLSSQTTATQVDGNYHSARRLPELTTTPVERLEGSKFRGIPGIGSLQQFLTVPDKFNLKFIFSNDQFYDPLLFFYGWHRLQTLENGIVVWERAGIPPLPEVLPRREIPLYQRWMFGLLPFTALCLAILTATSPYWSIPISFLAELLGLDAINERLSRPRNTLPHRLWQKVDNRLMDMSQFSDNENDTFAPWQIWLRYFMLFSLKRLKPASPTARQVRTVMLALIFLSGLAVNIIWYRNSANQPVNTVDGYYDDLDFRRFADAYARLNPETRPEYDQFLLELSVQGGLVASYAKLESLETHIVKQGPDFMEVDVSARYVTSLDYYTDTVRLTLSNLDGEQWYIEPAPVDLTIPPDQFIRRPEIQWFSQGRRRITPDPNYFSDRLDRPKLHVLAARLVKTEAGGFAAVGELMNIDVDPADVTVSTYVYDTTGEELVWYNANEVIMHKLLPQEITPFRVDFEGVAGLALEEVIDPLDFDPTEVWSYRPPEGAKLGDFSVFAQAEVTQRDLYRDVGAQNLIVDEVDGQLVLQGQLINNGIREATIPHILVSLYDEQGQIMWVDHHFVREAIRPQRTLDFKLPLAPITDLHLLNNPGYLFPSSEEESTISTGPRPDFIELPPGYGYRYLRVNVNYFIGGSG